MKHISLLLLITLSFFLILSQKNCNAQTNKKLTVPDTLVHRLTKKPSTINVLRNDYEKFGGKITTFTIARPPKAGQINIIPNTNKGVSLAEYTLKDLENRQNDSFAYQVCNENGQCDTATVLILKCSPSNPKFSQIEEKKIYKNEKFELNYPDKTLKIRFSKNPEKGTAKLNADSTNLIYTPPANFLGFDSFNVGVYRNEGKYCGTYHHESKNFEIWVLPTDSENKAPTATTDEVTVKGSKWVEIPVLENDTDPENSLHKKIIDITIPKHGEVKRTTKVVSYKAKSGFVGKDQFTYEVCDYNGACVTGTVNITVTK